MEKNRNISESQINELSRSTYRTQSNIAIVNSKYSLKITLLGNSSVGKTSLITKYCQEKFNPEGTNPTINVSIQEKIIKIDPFTEAKLNIWDTAGAEKYLSFTKGYLRDSNGIILVFDFTNEKSFESLDKWIELINDTVEEGEVEKILVGNKSDLSSRKISDEMANKYASEHGMKFISVSVKEGINIDYLFEVLGNNCVKKLQELHDKKEKETENEVNKENQEKISILSIDNNNKTAEKKPKRKCC